MKGYRNSWLITLLVSMVVYSTHAQEKKEQASIKVDLAYYQVNDEMPVLKASTKVKKGKKFEAVDGVDLSIYFKEESAKGFMGKVKTNNKGIGTLTLPERFKAEWASMPSSIFIVTLTANDSFKDASAELEIAKAKIELMAEEKDSVRTITARLLALQDSTWVPVPEAEIKLVVRRLLSDLKVGEEDSYTTDESGQASTEFTMTIPGDKEGNIFVGSKIDDNETYGNLVATKMMKWGIPLEADNSFKMRSLWATRDKTPLWLLIFPNLIIASVWGIIFYLLFQIARIIKLGKTN